MKYLDFKEHRQHGTIDFPVAYYYVAPSLPRYQMPYHWHTEYEIIRILDGILLLTRNGTELKLEKGDIVILHDGELHGATPYDCTYECIVFDMKFLLKENTIFRKQLQEIITQKAVLQSVLPADQEDIQKICATLFHALKTRESGYELITYGTFYHLLGLLIHSRLFSVPKEDTSKNRQRIDQFKNVISLIEEKYSDALTLADLSKAAGMTPKYFCRFFRGMTQKSPIEYLIYYRIECAALELTVSGSSITETAFNCGFNDISYFIKAFKKYRGITPKQFVKSLKSPNESA